MLAALPLVGGGFLLAVLWFDLMFDVQVLGRRDVSKTKLCSIADYYRRVTTDAAPMSYLVAGMMLVTVAALALLMAKGSEPRWVSLLSIILAAAPIVLALVRVVPNAVRLGAREGSDDEQHALARAICVDHLFCFASIAAFTLLRIAALPMTRP